MHLGLLSIFLLFGQIFSLYYFSKQLTKYLSQLLFRITRSQRWTIRLIALLFLPGTLLHELSHAIVAGMLLVDSGEISLWPKVEEKGVILGSVEIYKTGVIRRALIGVAPVIIGTSLIIGSLLLLVNFYQQGNSFPIWGMIIYAYVVFIVGNTMFSSKKDLEGSLEVLIGVFLALGLGYIFAKYKIPDIDSSLFPQNLVDFLQKANFSLCLLIIADIFIVGCLKLVLSRR